MTSPQKRKGYDYEREIVNKAREAGLEAERAYASDGRSLGLTPGVDVVINGMPCQCKRVKRVAEYIKPSNDVHAQIIRGDREESYVVIRLEDFLKCLKQG